MRSKAEIKKDVREHTIVDDICICYPRVYARVIYCRFPGVYRIAIGIALRGKNDRWNSELGANIAIGRAEAKIVERFRQEEEFSDAIKETFSRNCKFIDEGKLIAKFNKARSNNMNEVI